MLTDNIVWLESSDGKWKTETMVNEQAAYFLITWKLIIAVSMHRLY